ncbi:thioredoxin family protein [Draconibacterium halophilum]|uniref:Thioredoxin family protein n=1 Tax=Draconibacterium halophilum TaxID=2706887 RepID=A0A6C0RK35_9BACT|nr:thioredoxin family protein [Draconibacterium halophilum]QIA09601.1 thioredoxin family protein [Draconibacterium halophilum]
MFNEIKSIDEFITLKEERAALLAYFSTEACSVCKVLKPKVEEMAKAEFPKMELVYVKSDVLPDVAAQNSVFAAPTIVVFFDGRETIRKSRSFGVGELQQEISRYYSMLFD